MKTGIQHITTSATVRMRAFRFLWLCCVLSGWFRMSFAQDISIQGAVISISEGAVLGNGNSVTISGNGGIQNNGILKTESIVNNGSGFLPTEKGKVVLAGEQPSLSGENEIRIHDLVIESASQPILSTGLTISGHIEYSAAQREFQLWGAAAIRFLRLDGIENLGIMLADGNSFDPDLTACTPGTNSGVVCVFFDGHIQASPSISYSNKSSRKNYSTVVILTKSDFCSSNEKEEVLGQSSSVRAAILTIQFSGNQSSGFAEYFFSNSSRRMDQTQCCSSAFLLNQLNHFQI